MTTGNPETGQIDETNWRVFVAAVPVVVAWYAMSAMGPYFIEKYITDPNILPRIVAYVLLGNCAANVVSLFGFSAAISFAGKRSR